MQRAARNNARYATNVLIRALPMAGVRFMPSSHYRISMESGWLSPDEMQVAAFMNEYYAGGYQALP